MGTTVGSKAAGLKVAGMAVKAAVARGAAARSGGAESGGAVELAAGEAWQRQPVAPLRIELPGVAAIVVAPGGDATELRARLRATRDESARRCRELGVASLEAARSAHRERRAAEGEEQAARAVLGSLGSAAAGELEQRRTAVAGEVEELAAELAAMADLGDGVAADGAVADGGCGGRELSRTAAPPPGAPPTPRPRWSRRTPPSPPRAGTTRRRGAPRRRAAATSRPAAAPCASCRSSCATPRRATAAPASVPPPCCAAARRGTDRCRRRAPPAAGPRLAPPEAAERLAAGPDSLPADPGQLALFAASRQARTGGADGGVEEAAADAAPSADPLPAAVAAAELRVTAVGEELAAARRRLADARPDAVRRRAADGEAELGRLQREQRGAEDEHLAVRTRLEAAGDRALFERLEEGRARRAAARRAAASVEARAAAAARLLAAVDAARAAARRTYSEPLARTVVELGRPLFGADFAVELDADLNVARRTAFGTTLEFARLSTGAQEQLALLVRLACAVLISPAEGVPLIVDDALGYSDESRLRALGEVLSRVGERCQVLILTCFPERYRHVAGARRIRLEDPSPQVDPAAGRRGSEDGEPV